MVLRISMQKEQCQVPGCKRVAWGISLQLYCKRHTEEIFSARLRRPVIFNRNTGVDHISGKTLDELKRERRAR